MSTSFDQTLADVRHAMSVMSSDKWCLGNCRHWVKEGARSYQANDKIIDGKCSTCNRPPYSSENDPTVPEYRRVERGSKPGQLLFSKNVVAFYENMGNIPANTTFLLVALDKERLFVHSDHGNGWVAKNSCEVVK